MQVAASAPEVDVGDVAHPQLVGARWHKSPDKVLPLVVAVVRVRRGAAPAGRLHQLVATQNTQE